MKSIILINIFLSLALFCKAQDAHFSQSELNKTFRNPATVGNIKSDHQLTASYRSQWSNIPSGYRNILLAYEKKGAKFSWGTQLLHNDAGKVSLKTTQVILNISYRKKLSNRDEFLSIGASGGMIQQKFNPTLFSFDNQYTRGIGLDPTSANKESFVKTTQFLPSATVGVFASKYFNKVKGSGGLSFAHINEPNSQFYESLNEKYAMRTSLFANAKLPIKKCLDVDVHLSWNKQSVAYEKIIGAKINYQLNKNNTLTAGISNRIKDALIMEAGISFPESSVTISYDMNNSSLTSATNTRGGWELTCAYFFNKKKKEETINPMFGNLNEKPIKKQVMDRDQDGIQDAIDACPHLYGDKVNNGCPTNNKDSDHDGLLDNVDSCPFLKGTAAMGGCPDSDKDGISDLKDYCPFLKGEKTNNGCPVMNKADHQNFLAKKSINVIVEFDTDKSYIKEYYKEELDAAAGFLRENKAAKVFISGHTDNEGDKIYNFKLGERRANNVMEYFLNSGVSLNQLSIISFGESKPIERNRNKYEKAKNRRVEVQIYD